MTLPNKLTNVSLSSLGILGLACAFGNAAAGQTPVQTAVQHVSFDSPEGWALKYFTSASLMSGLQPPPHLLEEPQKVGALTLGLELGWLPELSASRATVGFSGRKQEDLNKAPVFIRPNLRIGLSWKFALVAAGLPPVRMYGVTPGVFAIGLERPVLERERWRLGWRGYGQVGSVRGAFTCPKKALGFPAGSPDNPSGCVAESNDSAMLRYAGAEMQFSFVVPRFTRVIPHAAAGINLIDAAFQVDAPLVTRLDHNRLWTRGVTFSGTGGVSYRLTRRMALTVDAFYTPLQVRRDAAAPSQIDGLFNVRAMISYALR